MAFNAYYRGEMCDDIEEEVVPPVDPAVIESQELAAFNQCESQWNTLNLDDLSIVQAGLSHARRLHAAATANYEAVLHGLYTLATESAILTAVNRSNELRDVAREKGLVVNKYQLKMNNFMESARAMSADG